MFAFARALSCDVVKKEFEYEEFYFDLLASQSQNNEINESFYLNQTNVLSNERS